MARTGFLRKLPLCKYCKEAGKLTPSSVVDHIIPHRGNKELFWDRANWQPLCKSHHDAKTAKEDGGFGN
ncbi:HNH endonuclease signature motif containing protein [Paenibacillus chitinolyticus]|uniref:HNH endonuclease signature motif containing protein n=1 Tax=Paenibacillus chitinolyticus TaxID=79263 RepID=UPI0036DE6732